MQHLGSASRIASVPTVLPKRNYLTPSADRNLVKLPSLHVVGRLISFCKHQNRCPDTKYIETPTNRINGVFEPLPRFPLSKLTLGLMSLSLSFISNSLDYFEFFQKTVQTFRHFLSAHT